MADERDDLGAGIRKLERLVDDMRAERIERERQAAEDGRTPREHYRVQLRLHYQTTVLRRVRELEGYVD